MNLLTNLLIVTSLALPAHGERHPDAVEIFHSAFERDDDANFDDWPDHWVRKRGPEHPAYLEITLRDQEDSDNRLLQIDLNGGAAAVFSPPVPVDARFAYLVEVGVRTQALVHSAAVLSITFYDAQQRELETRYSDRCQDAEQWTRLKLGPLSPRSSQATTAVIGLHVLAGDKHDLQGWVQFDDVWMARLPRMVLETNHPFNLFTSPDEVRVRCQLSGIRQQQPELEFTLLDESDQVLAQHRGRIAGQQIAEADKPAAGGAQQDTSQPVGYAGTTEWQPPLVGDRRDPDAGYGFYRVRVVARSAQGIVHQREISFAVVHPWPKAARGEFGWSLPDGERPLTLDTLTALLPMVGIHWVKFPIWYEESQRERGDQLMWFAERLGAHNLELVGMLSAPPDEVLAQLDAEVADLSAAKIFVSDPSHWAPTLDVVMTRLSLKIRWWQLGNDHDTSFVGYPGLVQKIDEIKRTLYRFGQQVHLGLGWRWLAEMQPTPNAPWSFLTFSAEPPLTGQELSTYLQGTAALHAKRWVVVEPLARDEYTLETRARDLVDQMLAAKIHGADGIFVPQPFSSAHGVMNHDGTPGELLLPWRTTALMLGGAKYLGSITLPEGSTNHLFTRDGEALMVVWNDKPVEEVIYLGDDVRQLDLWGRTTRPRQVSRGENEGCQVIAVGPVPTFVVGLHEPIARWRMAVRFEAERMPSVIGTTHKNALHMTNTFGQGIGGELTFAMPDNWDVYPRQMPFKASAGEELVKPFEIKLPFTANSGQHRVHVDFTLHLDKTYRFRVYRQLGIGLGDVEIEITTKLDANDVLVVEQRMISKSDVPADFKCLLHAPDRRRQSVQVYQLARGEDVKQYYFPNGHELLGTQLWLRAEEVDGPRILNYRFMVKAP